MLGSQGTERGISACLQDTMYFLEEREEDNLGPLGAHLFGQTSVQAYCVPSPVLSPAAGRDSCLARETAQAHSSSENIHTQSGVGRDRGLRVLGEGSVTHTLAELKRLHPYASVSSSVKWDQ